MVNANDLMNVLRKSKKRNFTEVEVETLVGEMEARKVVLFGIGIANNKKQSEWQHVAAAVNSVSSTERTVPELKKIELYRVTYFYVAYQ